MVRKVYELQKYKPSQGDFADNKYLGDQVFTAVFSTGIFSHCPNKHER